MGALLVAIALLLLVRLQHVLLISFVSLLLAAAMSEPVDLLERARIPRLLAATVLQLVAIGLIALGFWLVLPPVLDQASGIADRVPDEVQRFQALRDTYDDLRREHPELGSLDEQVSSASERIATAIGSRLIDLPMRLAQVLLDLLAISVISALLVAKRPQLQEFTLSLVHVHHRERTRRVLDLIWFRLGRYVRAKLIVMTIVGGITFAVLVPIGVQYPLLLAVIVAFGELIPQVGPWIARVPLFAVAALDGGRTLVLVIIASVVIENLKGYVISPFVEGDQLDIDPLVVILAVLAGGALLGPIGALVAVPAAAAVQVFCEEVLIPWRRRQIEEGELVLPAAALAPDDTS